MAADVAPNHLFGPIREGRDLDQSAITVATDDGGIGATGMLIAAQDR